MRGPFHSSRVSAYPSAIGCDEVGRGALCGPVVVAAVWFNPPELPGNFIEALDDSKKLNPVTREMLAQQIFQLGRVAVAASSAARIDQIGIRPATLDAMCRAISSLPVSSHVYVDGRDIPPGLTSGCTALVRGESQIPQIAASSIVAKTLRDRIMRTLGRRHPEYRWERNSGYGTSEHLEALGRFGPTRHHRNTFSPVSQLQFQYQEHASFLDEPRDVIAI